MHTCVRVHECVYVCACTHACFLLLLYLMPLFLGAGLASYADMPSPCDRMWKALVLYLMCYLWTIDLAEPRSLIKHAQLSDSSSTLFSDVGVIPCPQ